MSTSLNLFAQPNVNLDFRLFGWHLFNWIPEQYQNLNSIWIVVLSPVLVFIYNSLGRVGKDPSVAVKFVYGFVAVAIGFFIYGVGARWEANGQVSSWIMVWGYGLYSLGELLVSGLGLAMIARYVPARMGGFMMGAYFVATDKVNCSPIGSYESWSRRVREALLWLDCADPCDTMMSARRADPRAKSACRRACCGVREWCLRGPETQRSS